MQKVFLKIVTGEMYNHVNIYFISFMGNISFLEASVLSKLLKGIQDILIFR